MLYLSLFFCLLSQAKEEEEEERRNRRAKTREDQNLTSFLFDHSDLDKNGALFEMMGAFQRSPIIYPYAFIYVHVPFRSI